MTATFQPYAGGPSVSKDAYYTIVPPGSQQTAVTAAMSTTSFTTVEDAIIYAHVDCNSACGYVEFLVDGNRWVTWPLDDNGNTSADTYNWFFPGLFTVAPHTLTAAYLGSPQNAPASTTIPFTINAIGSQPTTLNLTMSPPTFSVTQDAVAYANVSCSSTAGLVQYVVDNTEWAIWPLDTSGNAYPDTLGWPNPAFSPGVHLLGAC